jgi:hypothetical protein
MSTEKWSYSIKEGVCWSVCLPVATITYQKINIGGRNYDSIFAIIMIYVVPNIIKIYLQEEGWAMAFLPFGMMG